MPTRIVILGGGTGGTMMANRLRRRYERAQVSIAVVDRDDRHVYQPGLLFVPFGLAYADEIVRSRRRQLSPGIDFHETEVEQVVLEDDAPTSAPDEDEDRCHGHDQADDRRTKQRAPPPMHVAPQFVQFGEHGGRSIRSA